MLPTRVEDPGGEVDPDQDPSHREKTGSVSNRQEQTGTKYDLTKSPFVLLNSNLNIKGKIIGLLVL